MGRTTSPFAAPPPYVAHYPLLATRPLLSLIGFVPLIMAAIGRAAPHRNLLRCGPHLLLGHGDVPCVVGNGGCRSVEGDLSGGLIDSVAADSEAGRRGESVGDGGVLSCYDRQNGVAAAELSLGIKGETKPQRAAGLRSSPATRRSAPSLRSAHRRQRPSTLFGFRKSGELIPDAVVPPGYLDIPRIK